jgi:hypothetical protein
METDINVYRPDSGTLYIEESPISIDREATLDMATVSVGGTDTG